MLVLTRRPSDKILFPKLGIAIHVVRVDGRSVRLGIDAPRDVHVVRHELAEPARQSTAGDPRLSPSTPMTHEMRNQLQTAMVSLQLLQRLMELGQLTQAEVESQLGQAVEQLEAMEAGLGGPKTAPVPRQNLAAHRTARPSQSTKVARLPAPWRPRRTALLIEDNANERSLLAGYLQTYDYEVATACDGADALEYLATHEKPDVVLIDMNMPRVGGAATVHVIRSTPELAGMKLVAVSGLAPPQVNVPLGKDGVDHWFQKPIQPEQLVQQLDRELNSAEARRTGI